MFQLCDVCGFTVCAFIYIQLLLLVLLLLLLLYIYNILQYLFCTCVEHKWTNTYTHMTRHVIIIIIIIVIITIWLFVVIIYICEQIIYILYVNIYEQTGYHIPYNSHMMHGFISTASTGWHGSPDPDLGPGQRGEDHHPQDHDVGRYLPYHAYTGLQHQEHHAGWLQVETRLKLMFPHDVLTSTMPKDVGKPMGFSVQKMINGGLATS